MDNEKELILALERAKAKLLARRQQTDAKEAEAINHNLKLINVVIGDFNKHGRLAPVQIKVAEKVIERANQKERIRLQ